MSEPPQPRQRRAELHRWRHVEGEARPRSLPRRRKALGCLRSPPCPRPRPRPRHRSLRHRRRRQRQRRRRRRQRRRRRRRRPLPCHPPCTGCPRKGWPRRRNSTRPPPRSRRRQAAARRSAAEATAVPEPWRRSARRRRRRRRCPWVAPALGRRCALAAVLPGPACAGQGGDAERTGRPCPCRLGTRRSEAATGQPP